MPIGYDTADRADLAEGAGAPAAGAGTAPIQRLGPNTDLHQTVLQRLNDRIKMSERQMTGFYSRWRAAELQYQAYMKTETMDQLRKGLVQRGTAPELVTITVPYTFASLQTTCTYFMHAFCGRNPMFQVGTNRADHVRKAQNLELLLQYNADRERLIRRFWQFFLDGEMYGLQILRNMWKTEERLATQHRMLSPLPGLSAFSPQMQPIQERTVTFEGNEVTNIDPFKFFPDPRVPLEDVARRGEFVFWLDELTRCELRKAEMDGKLAWVKDVPVGRPASTDSERGRLAGQKTQTWATQSLENETVGVHQGTVDIIPAEWGLGDGEGYEKWLFAVGNGLQIIQATPLGYDHGKHPVTVGEPLSAGYEFGQIGMTDMIGPMQEMLSWMLNSHLFNVRAALNNSFLVNPQMVDIEDLKKPGPGRVIKLKPAAFGQDISNAFSQLPVVDVTQGHITDMQVIQRLADNISATSDTLRGVVNSGGRKSATEVRQSGEAGASRLAARARFISAQTICPQAEMMSINFQQLMSQDVQLQVLGQDGAQAPINVNPGEISGSFYFPIHDGMLPLDRVALLEVWKEIFMGIIKVPGFAQAFDILGIFEYMAKLGGATNLSTFRVQTMQNADVDKAIAAGNMAPAGQAPGPGPSPVVPRPLPGGPVPNGAAA